MEDMVIICILHVEALLLMDSSYCWWSRLWKPNLRK